MTPHAIASFVSYALLAMGLLFLVLSLMPTKVKPQKEADQVGRDCLKFSQTLFLASIACRLLTY